MKRLLCAGERYAFPRSKINLYLTSVIIRQKRVIAVFLSLLALYLQAVQANETVPAQPTSRAGFSLNTPSNDLTAPTDSITPLQIGDTIPEYLWNLPLQVVNRPQADGKETVTLADYRGKLIILDFWATWCGSCIAAMPAITDVQKDYADKMVVIPVSQSEAEVTNEALLQHPILHPLDLLSIVNADQLIAAFPHRVLPFYVWIDPDGVVVATTASGDVTNENVKKTLQGLEPRYELMTDIDRNAPLLLNERLLPASAGIKKFSLLIQGHIPSLPSGSRFRMDQGRTVGYFGTNLPVGSFYYTVARGILGPQFSRKQIEILADTLLYPEIHPSSSRKQIGDDRSKFLSYEFRTDVEYADSLYHLMLEDLNQCSGFHGSIEQREVPCYVLQWDPAFAVEGQAGNTGERILLNGQSSRVLARRLEREGALGGLPVIDETGMDRPLTITVDAFNGLEELQAALRQYGIILSKAERTLDFFLLSKS